MIANTFEGSWTDITSTCTCTGSTSVRKYGSTSGQLHRYIQYAYEGTEVLPEVPSYAYTCPVNSKATFSHDRICSNIRSRFANMMEVFGLLSHNFASCYILQTLTPLAEKDANMLR